jgi:YD repeat-containing protein
MKISRLLLLTLLFPALVVIGCDKTGKTDNSGGVGVPSKGSRLVSNITGTNENEEFVYDFTYDSDNRLIGINMSDEYTFSTVSISYEQETSDKVTIERQTEAISSYNRIFFPYVATFISGENGYLTSGNLAYVGGGNDESWIGTYNNAGYLIKSEINSDDDSESYDFTWSGGNMMQVSYEGGVADYEYSDVANNSLSNLDLNYLITTSFAAPFLGIAGLLGKRSANMIETMSITLDVGLSDSTSYTYETDSDGFVTKIKRVDGTVLTITYR